MTTHEPEPVARPAAPGVLLHRLSSSLDTLIQRGIAERTEPGVIELLLDDEEATEGGMATIRMYVPVPCPRCGGARTKGAVADGGGAAGCVTCDGAGEVEDLFSAWIAVPPGVAEGAVLKPSALLPGMAPIAFRVRRARGG